MSGKRSVWLRLIIAGMLAVLLLSVNAAAASPALNKKSASVKINGQVKLTVKNAKKVSSWFTDDPTVASVDSKGVVKGVGYGSANISVKADGKTLKAVIKVKDPRPDLKMPLPYSGYKKLSQKARGMASDVIAIAKSQYGYNDGLAYFGSKWNTYAVNLRDRDAPGSWCTDFATWCLVAARVPDSRGLFDVANRYRSDLTIMGYYSSQNSLYRYSLSSTGGSGSLEGYKIRGTLTPKTIKPGDIALVDKGHHSTIVMQVYSNGNVSVVEGNPVRIGRVISGRSIYAVARPAYNGRVNPRNNSAAGAENIKHPSGISGSLGSAVNHAEK